MSYTNLFLLIWEFERFLLGNLAYFYLGTWTDFAWELGRILLITYLYIQKKSANDHKHETSKRTVFDAFYL